MIMSKGEESMHITDSDNLKKLWISVKDKKSWEPDYEVWCDITDQVKMIELLGRLGLTKGDLQQRMDDTKLKWAKALSQKQNGINMCSILSGLMFQDV